MSYPCSDPTNERIKKLEAENEKLRNRLSEAKKDRDAAQHDASEMSFELDYLLNLSAEKLAEAGEILIRRFPESLLYREAEELAGEILAVGLRGSYA